MRVVEGEGRDSYFYSLFSNLFFLFILSPIVSNLFGDVCLVKVQAPLALVLPPQACLTYFPGQVEACLRWGLTPLVHPLNSHSSRDRLVVSTLAPPPCLSPTDHLKEALEHRHPHFPLEVAMGWLSPNSSNNRSSTPHSNLGVIHSTPPKPLAVQVWELEWEGLAL